MCKRTLHYACLIKQILSLNTIHDSYESMLIECVLVEYTAQQTHTDTHIYTVNCS